jgi:hypothetical protein
MLAYTDATTGHTYAWRRNTLPAKVYPIAPGEVIPKLSIISINNIRC